MDPWRQVSPRAPDGSRRRTGTFVGRVRVTPTRVFTALATVGGIETYRAARAGRPARSFLAAIAGGVAGLVALACFAAAAILSILSRTP